MQSYLILLCLQEYGSCIVTWKCTQAGVLRWHGLSWMENSQIKSCSHRQLIFPCVNKKLKLIQQWAIASYRLLSFSIFYFLFSFLGEKGVEVLRIELRLRLNFFLFLDDNFIYRRRLSLQNCNQLIWMKNLHEYIIIINVFFFMLLLQK